MLSQLSVFKSCPDCGAGKDKWGMKLTTWDSSYKSGKTIDITGDKSVQNLRRDKLKEGGLMESCSNCKRFQFHDKCFFCSSFRMTMTVFEYQGEARFLCVMCAHFVKRLSAEEQAAIEIGFSNKQLKEKFSRRDLQEIIVNNKQEIERLLILKSV